MDDSGHRDNGRHKAEHQYRTSPSQWLMQHQPSMNQILNIMAERDAAIQERNLALTEKKQALTERDMAFHQRDSALGERNNALMERDNALATLQYRDGSIHSTDNMQQQCPPECDISRGVKHMHHHNQIELEETSFNTRDHQLSESLPLSPAPSEDTPNSRKSKRPKDSKQKAYIKKAPKLPKISKREGDDLNKILFGHRDSGSGSSNVVKSDWRNQDTGLNQIIYDETTMAPPVCSCTGTFRQCYKWGSGGWQSSCCTKTLSVYPLPAVANKRHARVGGRKMSGSAYNKLLNRLAGEGIDLSNPIDLKDKWAKHGTNRYITIK